ncbi:hypothetical protein OAL01_01790 [Rubripirellula sp.]|nr:hypothetical protein [Rubripirellula sp.]
MSLPDIILASVLFLLLVGFAVVVWKAASNWRWFNIVAIVLTMLLALVFLFPTAGVLRSRSAWHEVLESLELRLAQVKAETADITLGEAVGAEASRSGGLIDLQSDLSSLAIEAGRRWRNLQLKDANLQGPMSISLGPPPANDLAGQPAPPAANAQPLVPAETLVYGFSEVADDNQMMVPAYYLGEFIVQASNPNQVTLVPTGTLEQYQVDYIKDGKARSWLLCELLPPDGHVPFIKPFSQADDKNCLGLVDEELVRELLVDASDETRLGYLEDGRASKLDDPPATKWVELQFTRNHGIQVDSPDERTLEDGGFFDGNGRALDAALQHGADGYIRFKKGDKLLLKSEGAAELIDQGVAEELGSFFLRPLNDYGFVLRRIRLNLMSLADKKAELTAEELLLKDAISRTDRLLVANQEVKLKLEQDLTQFRVEKQSISEYKGKITAEAKAMVADLNRLEQENAELEQQIEQKHLKIERQIDALTKTP